MRRRQFIQGLTVSAFGFASGHKALAAETAKHPDIDIGSLDGHMQSAWRSWRLMRREGPLELDGGAHLFSDWRYVSGGRLAWHSAGGERLPLRGPGPFPDAGASHRQIPHGITLRSQPAEISGPVEGVWPGTLIH